VPALWAEALSRLWGARSATILWALARALRTLPRRTASWSDLAVAHMSPERH
jgi:hypothetical protein